MDKVLTALKSRTVWTAVAVFVVNGASAVQDLIPSGWLPFVNAVLLLLTSYFRVNPRV